MTDQPPSPIGRQNEDALVAAMVEVERLVDELKQGLPRINDQQLRRQALVLTESAAAVTRAHLPEPKPTIADDLSGLMAGLLSFRVPDSDGQLGRTPTLGLLRTTKGLMIAGVNDALEAAERLGLRASKSPLHRTADLEPSRAPVEHLLTSVVERLSKVEKTLQLLEEDSGNSDFQQQQHLIDFYVGSMRVEVDLAKLHFNISGVTINIDALARAVEMMADITRDFVETVQAWKERLTRKVVIDSSRIAGHVHRLVRGVRAVGFRLMRQAVPRSKESALASNSPLIDVKVEGFSDEVISCFSSLRRYAHVLIGNPNVADDLLEALFRRNLPRAAVSGLGREVLFREWSKVLSARYIDKVVTSDRRLRKLLLLPLLHRQILLLSSMEDFSEEQTAFILSMEPQEIRNAQEELTYRLMELIRTTVLIVEDERFISMDLESLFRTLGMDVVGVARTCEDAVELARMHNPGLVSVDIQLADGSSGMDASEQMLKFLKASFIFITAYPERFLTDPNRPEPSFLISKPFQPAMVAAVAAQAMFFERQAVQGE
jgi:CheY-like chemotaxis protein